MTLQDQFWSWFFGHEQELFEFDPAAETERERLFDNVASALQEVHRELTFEFGPPGNKREFVISAGGIKSAFPAVIQLCDAAPSLERWQIIAFRPRRTPMTIEIGEAVVDPAEVRFTLMDNGKQAGLYLFIPGYRKDDIAYQQIGYLLLDHALGEYDVETKLGGIEMLAPSAMTKGERHPFSALPELFDRLVARFS